MCVQPAFFRKEEVKIVEQGGAARVSLEPRKFGAPSPRPNQWYSTPDPPPLAKKSQTPSRRSPTSHEFGAKVFFEEPRYAVPAAGGCTGEKPNSLSQQARDLSLQATLASEFMTNRLPLRRLRAGRRGGNEPGEIRSRYFLLLPSAGFQMVPS